MNRWSNFITKNSNWSNWSASDCFLTNHENSEAFGFLRFAVAKPGVGVGRTAPGGFHDGSAAPGFSKDWRWVMDDVRVWVILILHNIIGILEYQYIIYISIIIVIYCNCFCFDNYTSHYWKHVFFCESCPPLWGSSFFWGITRRNAGVFWLPGLLGVMNWPTARIPQVRWKFQGCDTLHDQIITSRRLQKQSMVIFNGKITIFNR
jgi:hypothetical protein